jgi:hypothetical protein
MSGHSWLNIAVIGKNEWAQLAKYCGVPFNLVQRLMKQLLKQTTTKLKLTSDDYAKEMDATGEVLVGKLVNQMARQIDHFELK